MVPAKLLLATGEQFDGFSLDPLHVQGEVVFNTGMVGYVESLTDPSYAGQILTFTYPLIGNYGIPDRDHWESPRIQVTAMVVAQLTPQGVHCQAAYTDLFAFCRSQAFPVLMGVDTRALTKVLRTHGVIAGTIVSDGEVPLDQSDAIEQQPWVKKVSIEAPVSEGEQGPLVIVIDCGIKANILRHLRRLPIRMKRVPYNYDFTQENYDGVFISNGPGDPICCEETIALLKKVFLENKPVFGICLGAQLMALAIGARTYKLPFGHRAQNQPCLHLATNRCVLTSQNHGYAIDETSLPEAWDVTFRSLNDATVQGIAHRNHPFSAVQFHPEAAPGPTDTAYLFEQFFNQLQARS